MPSKITIVFDLYSLRMKVKMAKSNEISAEDEISMPEKKGGNVIFYFYELKT